MKAILIHPNKEPGVSFAIRVHKGAFFDYPLHFHPQYELTYIEKGKGIRFVGNSIETFQDGDLVFLGQNISHCWRNNPEYYLKDSTLSVHCIVVQFDHNVLGNGFFEIPENYSIKKLFERASEGLRVEGKNKTDIVKSLKNLTQTEGVQKVILLIEILGKLADEKATVPISFGTFTKVRANEIDRMNDVVLYVSNHFQQKISLDNVASIAHMNRSAFCKFFKKRFQKTLTDFVNEVRIGFACQRIREGGSTITEICYLSGFQNFSNFSRAFKKFTALTPSEYSKKFRLAKP